MAIFKSKNTLLNNLSSYWDFNGNANDNWLNNNGTVNGATLDTGKINQCYYFDGVDDWINYGNVLNFSISDSFTASAWIYPTNVSVTQMILTKRSGTYLGILFIYLSTSKPALWLFNSQGVGIDVRGNYTLSDNNWYHISISYDGSGLASGVKIYVDSDLKQNEIVLDTLDGNDFSNSGNFEIGSTLSGSFEFKGKIDESGIWSKVLSETEINLLYNKGVGITFTNFSYIPKYSRLNLQEDITSYWKLDDTTGNTIDSFGKNNGTLSGNILRGQQGVINTCYYFDGNDDYINYGSSVLTNNYTLSGWYKFSSIGIMTFTENFYYSETDVYDGMSFRYNSSSNIIQIAHLNSSPYGTGQIHSYSWIPTVDTWYFLVITYDGTTSKLYIDGEFKSKDEIPNANYTSNTILRTGARNISQGGVIGEYFNGYVDEIGVWHSPLTQEEIITLYNSTKAQNFNTFKQIPKKIGYNLLKDLINYWSFDVNANDIHRNNNGNVIGATLGIGKLNQSYYFDGVDDYITLNNDIIITSSKAFSIWFYLEDGGDTANARYIISDMGGPSNRGWVIGVYKPTKEIYWQGAENGVTLSVRFSNGANIQFNTWYHIVVNLDLDNLDCNFYLNGQLINNDSGTIYSSYSNSSNPTQISGYNFFGAYAAEWKGYIDEIGIWNRLLTVDEISALYNNGFGLKYDNFRY